MYVHFLGPAGQIEAIEQAPLHPLFASIVCHPHPQFGGTMHNHATFRLARALSASGGVALRFHFRGVGRSAGHFDDGRGEAEDALAVLAELERRHPGLPLWVAGFSFGARMALEAAARHNAVQSALVFGMAVRTADHDVARRLRIPIAVVQASDDEFGKPHEVEELLRGSSGPRRIWVVEGTTHLFTTILESPRRPLEVPDGGRGTILESPRRPLEVPDGGRGTILESPRRPLEVPDDPWKSPTTLGSPRRPLEVPEGIWGTKLDDLEKLARDAARWLLSQPAHVPHADRAPP